MVLYTIYIIQIKVIYTHIYIYPTAPVAVLLWEDVVTNEMFWRDFPVSATYLTESCRAMGSVVLVEIRPLLSGIFESDWSVATFSSLIF